MDNFTADPETMEKIIAEELTYGVDYRETEKKYYFVFDEENGVTNTQNDQPSNSYEKLECIYIRPGFLTPSQKEKMTETEELRLRILGAEMIQEAGYSLRLPWYAIATAQAIFHRFYFRKSFLEYDIKDIVMASVFLCTKIDECIRKVRDIVSVCYHVFKIRAGVQKPFPELNLSSHYYLLMRQAVVDSERIVLKELGFELHRLTDHCQKYLIYYLKAVRVPREIAQKAWAYTNDCYKGPLCVNYPPHVLAASCLYLAIWTTKTPMPRCIWWAIFETSIKHIMEVCADLLILYQQPKMTLEDLRVLMNDCFKRNNIDIDYVVDNEAAYEKEQQEREKEFAAQIEKQKEAERAEKSDKRHPPEKRDRSKSRSHDHRRDKEYRSDKKKKKKRSYSRDKRDRSREKRRSPSRSASDSESPDDKKKKKKKKDRKHRSTSSSEDSRRKRSTSRSKKDKKKNRDKDRDSKERRHRDKRDRSRDREPKKEAPRPVYNPRERMSSLERLNEQIKVNEQIEREKHLKELEKARESKPNIDIEEPGIEAFIKKSDKKPSKPPSLNISLEALKSAALGEKKEAPKESEQFVVNVNFIKSASKTEDKIQPEPEKQPEDEKKNGDAKDLDEDEAALLALKQKIQENKKTKKKGY